MEKSTKKVTKKTTRSVKKEIEKTVKKTHSATIIIVLVFFILGIVGGYFGYKYLIKNDEFKLIGDSKITINQNSTLNEALYNENSVSLVIFGKDAKDKIEIKMQDGGIDTSKAGTYYITYKTSSIRFYGVVLVREIVVLEAE